MAFPSDSVMLGYLEVVPRNNEPVDRLVKRFTKKVRLDGILHEFRTRSFFEKPSVKRRRKSARAVARAKKEK